MVCYVMLRCVVLCYAMLCYVMLCCGYVYDMLCYVMLCDVCMHACRACKYVRVYVRMSCNVM